MPWVNFLSTSILLNTISAGINAGSGSGSTLKPMLILNTDYFLLSNVYVHEKRQLWCMEDITNLQNTVWALMVTHILIIGCRIDSAPYTIMKDTGHRLNKRIKDKFKNSQRSVISVVHAFGTFTFYNKRGIKRCFEVL
jgi:hypothetical protein